MEQLEKHAEKLLDAIMTFVMEEGTIPWAKKRKLLEDMAKTSEIWDQNLEEFISWFEEEEEAA
jgi:hypothetical protein